MNLKDIITNDIADLRTQATNVRQAAETEAQKIEGKLISMPAELEALAEAEALKVWDWLKGA